MTGAAALRIRLLKETRALLPAWAASAAAVALAGTAAHPLMLTLATLAFAFGTIALGAQCLGHEYTYRTLGSLLAQPVNRHRLLLTKLAVLGVLVVPLGALATRVFAARATTPRDAEATQMLVLLVLACSLLLAPVLTLLTRSVLGGAVFAMAVPGIAMITAELLAYVRYGAVDGPGPQALKLTLFSWTVLVACVAGAGMTWRVFSRLEVVEGPGQDISFPSLLPWRRDRGSDAPASSERHPIWLTFLKELRLQSMTFVIAGAYIAVWMLVMVLRRLYPDFVGLPLVPLSIMYMLMLAIVTGALAAAEERQFGTLQSHLLLPMAVWQQWLVKAATVLIVALLIGAAVPAALSAVSGTPPDRPLPLRAWEPLTAAVVVLSMSSLYVSSLCSSGVRAVIFSMPVIGVSAAWIQVLVGIALRIRGAGNRAPILGPRVAVYYFGAALVVFLLRLGYLNYRHTGKRRADLALQFASIATLLTAGALFVTWMSPG